MTGSKSLRRRLGMLVVLATLPALGLACYTGWRHRASEREGVAERVLRITRLLGAEEAHSVEAARQLLAALAEAPELAGDDAAAASRHLARVRERLPRYLNLGVILRDGAVFASALPWESVDLADRDYFRSALRTGRFVAGRYQIGRITKRASVNFAHPIRGSRVVFAALDVAAMGTAGEAAMPAGAVLHKVDASGTILARTPPDAAVVGRTLPGWERLAADESGVFEEAGEIIAFARVPGRLSDGRVHAVLSIPSDVAYADVHRLFALHVGGILLTALFALLALEIGGRRLFLRPVRRLVRAARGLGSGEPHVRLGPPYERSELGQLARAFDEAAEALREREEARARAEDRRRTLVWSAPWGIARIGRDGRFLSCNPAFVEMLGYEDADDVLELDPARDVARDPEEWRAWLDRCVRRPCQGEDLAWKRRGGAPLVARVSGSPVAGEDCVEILAENVTRRRQLQEQVRQSQKLDAVGKLAGGVAHDFNNLLCVVLGNGELLLRRLAEGDESREYVEEILEAGQRASVLTRQLLLFSRSQPAEPRLLDLNEVVAGMQRILPRLIGASIRTTFSLGMGLGRIRGDTGQIEQVLVNLVVNARDAMPDGGRLTIETANVDLDEAYAAAHANVRTGPHTMLAVTDTGCGMDDAIRARIFEPFFTTKADRGGTGLGLATVYTIVRRCGASIWVYSEPGRGTTFKVYFPHAADAAEDALHEPAPAVVEAPCGTETILLVEDERRVRKLTRLFLEERGYRVIAVETPEEAALAAESEGPVDLLVTDVILPGKSGAVLAEELCGRHPSLRVLFVSGYADDAIARHGILEPGRALLTKPYARDTLLRKVREVLDAAPVSP